LTNTTYDGELTGVGLDDLKDNGLFLEGAIVTIKDGQFFKLEQKYHDDKKNEDVVKNVIAARIMGITAKNHKDIRVGELSTGIAWDSDAVTVTSDGKALVAKRALTIDEKKKLIGKNAPWAFFLRSANRAGVSDNDISIFRADCLNGMTFQFTNDKPSKSSKRTYTVPLQLQGGGTSFSPAAEAPASAPSPASNAPSPETVAKVTQALTSVVQAHGTVSHMELFQKGYLNEHFGNIQADASDRNVISNVIYTQKASLPALLAGSAVTFDGSNFKAV
jgi:hypothetical protein